MKSQILVSILTLLALVGCGNSSKDPAAAGGLGASNCKLNTPVALAADPLEESANAPFLVFNHVRVDRLPSGDGYEGYVNGELELTIGQARFGSDMNHAYPTGHIGVIVKYGQSFGFGSSAFFHLGGYSFEGRKTTADGVTTITTRETDSKAPSIVQVQIINGMITAIEIQVPIRRAVTDGHVRTGQVESICVKEMTFDKIEH